MKLDLIIQTEDHAVDMKSGLETLSGTSESIRTVVEAALTDHVSQRTYSTNKVRNKMMESFEGSYGVVFEVIVDDPDLKKKMTQIGERVLGELISYFIAEALYKDSPDLSDEAKVALDNISAETQDKLLSKLRRSPLENAHSVPTHFGYNVTIKRHLNNLKRRDLVVLDREGKTNLAPRTNKNVVTFRACITRLNINTGNGRLLKENESDTIAFGFTSSYRDVRVAARKKFSENLNKNNGIPSDQWEYIDITATTLRLKSGHIIKYMISGFE
ncbi:hypothetical protein [Vibrio methylphosphonaticus]|uniref:hypothetical protein n=1 Tax=Vibrio methylphosphonaticus TaxID=2946866 RepID=UPI00202A4E5A|nr:hypothetical protein [Vibrio methylphosphonaticus]MCL9777047.1 hypothetical protein [Vibrio methylphosphonaticus]